MVDIYELLAPLYDELNQDVDYEKIASFTDRQIQAHASRGVHKILDLACGTGALSLPLASRGYSVVGLDLSPNMLSVASEKAREAGLDCFFTMQDMTDFDLGGEVDAVVCTMDGINHLTQTEEMRAAISCVGRHLADGGIFVFDVNSKFKFEYIYGDEAYTMETDTAFCVWQNVWRPSSRICDFLITLFEKDADGRYRRYDALQRERYYPLKTLSRTLLSCGMELLAVYGSTECDPVGEDSEKWYLVARKVKQI